MLGLKNKIILVTGGAGSIGSEIVAQLFNYRPKKIIVLDQAENGIHNLSLKYKNKSNLFKTVLGNICDEARVKHLLKQYKPNIVFHCAAYKHLPVLENNPYEAVNVNLIATRILADLSVLNKVEKFVFISTDKAVMPSSILGATKRGAEIYLQTLQLKSKKNDVNTSTKFLITRFGNVLDSIGSVSTVFREQIKRGKAITVTNKNAERYFMSINEASDLVLKSCEIGSGGEIFIFDMGKPIKILDLAHKMMPLDKTIEVVEIGLKPGEKMKESLMSIDDVLLKTSVPKIRYIKPSTKLESYEVINKKIDKIQNSLLDYNNKKIVKALKNLVLDFNSLNCLYKD